MNKTYIIAVVIVSMTVMSGCAVLDVPKPEEIIKTPLGSSSVKIGMTKNEVISIYGDPNIKSTVNAQGWEKEREEWFYKARIDVIPLGANYLTEDVYLYFDGENLTNISKTPLGKSKEE